MTYVSLEMPHSVVPARPDMVLVLPSLLPDRCPLARPPLWPGCALERVWEDVLCHVDVRPLAVRVDEDLVALLLGKQGRAELFRRGDSDRPNVREEGTASVELAMQDEARTASEGAGEEQASTHEDHVL